ncbi:pheromone processing endoprotease [Monosporozyma unispora]|nr:pheromone processing endoprotease [Kazachstania unispora]
MVLPLLTNAQKVPPKNHEERQYFAIESTKDINTLIQNHPNWRYEHDVRGLENHYVFSQPLQIDSNNSIVKRSDYSLLDDIVSFQDLPLQNHLQRRVPVPVPPIDSSMLPMKEAEEKLNINDPSFEKQWHLFNPSYPGNDINMADVWYNNITGNGVVVAIVDDGVDYDNPDIKDNFSPEGSWDFNDNTNLPKPRLTDDYHGTRCAGEIAAAKGNDFCGVGVAYNSKVAGLRILSGGLTAEDEAASLIYGLDVNDIYSCSWGPSDDGKHLQGPSVLVKKSLIKGTNDGRDKKGSIYVFASGNGGHLGDNCNYDGYTNSIYSITIGAIDHKGLHPPYSESCSAVMAVTYSSGSGEWIHSTDIGDKCSDTHGGTSAAAPLAAGIYALLLEANPDLTWRDVQYLSILSSKEITNRDAKSQDGALGKKYSHVYGYGKIDAKALVEMAKDWENVKPQAWYFTDYEEVNKYIKNPDDIIESIIRIDADTLKNANFERMEHITITVDVETDIRGQVNIDLISPSGMVSNLAVTRERDNSNEGFINWNFMSVAHWGEKGVGEWKLRVKTTVNDNNVKLNHWRLRLFGESIDASKSRPYDYNDDKYAQREAELIPIEDITNPATSETEVVSQLSTVTSVTATHYVTLSSATASATVSATVIPDPDDDPSTPNEISSPRQALHYFITLFAVGSILLILYFVIFFKSRRRIRRTRAENYEFDIIDTDSDYDSTLDSHLSRDHEMTGTNDIADYDFDLSDEDNLVNGSPFNTPTLHQDTTNIDDVLDDSVEYDREDQEDEDDNEEHSFLDDDLLLNNSETSLCSDSQNENNDNESSNSQANLM